MDLKSFQLLLTPSGQVALQAAGELEPREADFLRDFTALSRLFPPELARPALEIAILRREASSKFPHASRMYFTRPALEQASSWEVSAYRATRFRDFTQLADLGCSIGGDTLVLASLAPTIGIDLDPLRLAMAHANASSLDLNERVVFVQADLAAPLPMIASRTALFFDPARRAGVRRIFSVRDYQPPLSTLLGWVQDFPALGVKISPGVDLAELTSYERDFGVEIEFVSLRGELKEAVLWFGPLRHTRRQATLLPGPHILSHPGSTTNLKDGLPLSKPLGFLYEPDPAVLRAGLVAQLGNQLDAAQLDPDIAYLTADKHRPTPFARAWAIEDWLPFNLKRLRTYLRQHGVSRVVVKKRGSPVQPEELIQSLRLPGNLSGVEKVLFLTHYKGDPIVVVASSPELLPAE